MAVPRVEIPDVVISTTGAAVSGASVQVNVHGGSSATVYSDETGAGTLSNPLTTDSSGRITGWLTEGSYDLVVSGSGITSYTQYFEAVKGNKSVGALATAAGDLVYAVAANDLTRLPVGTTGQYLSAVTGGSVQWAAATFVTYRKSTSKTVNTTTSATDLLNAEITIAGGDMSTNKTARLTAWGDYLQNSGGSTNTLRFQLVLGGTTLIDTGAGAGSDLGNSATRGSWRILAEITNLGAANSQWTNFRLDLAGPSVFSNGAAFTTGEGWYFGNTRPGGGGGNALGQGAATSSVDTATAKSLVLNVINPSASGSCETKLYAALVEVC